MSWRRPRAYATLARVRRPAMGRLNSGVSPMRKVLTQSLLIFTSIVVLAACDNVICDESHSSVTLARGISQEKWAELFSEAENIVRTQPFDLKNAPVKTSLPKFKLSPLHFVSYSKDATVKLAGCFDHGVYLSLYNLNTPKGKIELSWGEGPEAGSEVLWSRRPTP